ncbi:LytTR family two component transcriptional regulator [Pontibacter ummariensis]|uniref:Two component transcriptional regulator, LytTR family n=1 Tax=Pontibacter ummariensis TaxID=1610492 RepID=A0A239LW07_9BACT|nr:LytTR family DNA-binding domain-containing protein [Pontibacter ummariensis]PRY00364.1 LytTR family two component transcriptional regulator [Pontibacter ummariensis]SNT34450.1 two component transcriptional regulator, LytTR family [Pontibacter ummariensis]
MENKYRCLIVDDEPLARQLLQEYVQKVPFLQLQGACAGAMEALRQLGEKSVDLLFLDINMPEVSGLTLLRTLPHPPKVIFTTAFSEYAVQGFELNAADYLLKPITFDRFLRAVNKIVAPSSTSHSSVPATATGPVNPESLFLREGSRFIRINPRDIRYIEGLRDYVSIQTRSQGRIVCLQRLKGMEEQLPADRFIRVHNSYIINIEEVDALYRHKVHYGDKEVPVGETYRQRFNEFLRLRSIHL